MATVTRPAPERRRTVCLPATVLAVVCAVVLQVAVAAAPASPLPAPVAGLVQSGHLDEARRWLDGELRVHPQDARAHYAEAQVLAQQGLFGPARDELAAARRLAPGLPFAPADSVRALDQELQRLDSGRAPAPAGGADPGLVWSLLLAVAGGGLFAWALMRLARQTSVSTGVSKR
ncbi:hypothetical protein [Rubrivivax gelatinosus]|uniref:Tetratricopeptide repeat protein n=1 Tax=Rubrivivax gelatinosus TaxID=28068 RepID=A0A4R2M611_RUBGE|nr:hypothetical protein [Rubrivivax gelatinosus]MBK1686797.1 hypothetical protein [Rubrivivax gelatinosus]TCP01501.1 hypothetical protein EV684_109140 [Rubrivivax gelatinosus]